MNKLKKAVRIVLIVIAAVLLWFIMIIADCRSVYPEGRPVFAFIMTEDGELEVYHGLGYSIRLKHTPMGTVYYIEVRIFGQIVSEYDAEEYFDP